MKSLSQKWRSHEEEIDTEGTWAVSYGDMVTLLLTFFIVFFSIDPKQDNQRQAKALQMSLLDRLNQRNQNQAATTAPGVGGRAPAASIGDDKDTGIDPNVTKNLRGTAHQVGDHLIVEFPAVSFFKSGSTDVTREGQKALEGFVSTYLPYAGTHRLSIRAYTDSKPVGGGHRFKDNLELSALRSVATLRVLQKAGLPLSSMKLAGLGEHILTQKELQEIPDGKRKPTSELDFARKVVLVIEPEGT